ncbi:MAG: hypothetical protein RL101_715 [Actinomycetota bacterium]|jgi:hypothetical protein
MRPEAGIVRKIILGRNRSNSGSGTILGLGVVLSLLAVLVGSNLAVSRLFAAQKLQVQAEQIAVAVADSVRGLTTGYPCEVADQFAHMYMVKIAFCRIVDFECFLRLRSEQFDLVADARAGPPE